jgi:hypothetical protein
VATIEAGPKWPYLGSLKEASIGVTLCYPPGEGAGPEATSEYSLIASRHEREGGIFRIDMRQRNNVAGQRQPDRGALKTLSAP